MFDTSNRSSKKICDALEEEFKLIYGMLFSLKRFIALTSPKEYANRSI
jgi:hypothetical protein